eukprot:XP_016657582.1 PREDICTED: kelch-like protein 2 [Acyrthosiphon pisum]
MLVGGADENNSLKSVEYYDPILDTWTPVTEMSKCCQGDGVGVLDCLMYAIGGCDRDEDLKSVEVYRPRVVALDGPLYVMGGESDESSYNDTVFESVIKWVKQDLDQRKDFLTELMEHVRLPMIASSPDILFNIRQTVEQHGRVRRRPTSRPVVTLDAASRCYRETVPLGVDVLDDCIYAVGGGELNCELSSVEVFDVSIQKWRLVASMSTKRFDVGVQEVTCAIYK